VSADQGVQQQGDLQQLLQEFGDVFEVPSQLLWEIDIPRVH
jgi:hypothetical protein